MSGGQIWARGRLCAWATAERRRRTDLGSVGAIVSGCYRSVMVEVGGGAEAEISPLHRGRPICGSGVASLSPAVEGLRENWSGESSLIFSRNRGATKKGMREIRGGCPS